MRRGKGHVRLRRAARQFGFVQTVDGTARNKLHFHAGFFGELFGDSFVNQIPEAAAQVLTISLSAAIALPAHSTLVVNNVKAQILRNIFSSPMHEMAVVAI